jgi:Uma2 family endonuclease
MQLQVPTNSHTPEEYLASEEATDAKNEYRDGQIVPMTRGTKNHNKIAGNFYAQLKLGLKGQDYDLYIGDVRLWIPRYRQYTYPDLMVIPGDFIYPGTEATPVMSPLLIAEVLSKSTKSYDQGEKFTYYRSIPELSEYILIDQSNYHVMQYNRIAENQWLLTEYTSEKAELMLESVDLQINLSDIYERVNFDESED